MKHIRAIFFDVDGVLLDSLPMHLRFCEDKSREYGLGLKIPTVTEFKELARMHQISPMKYFLMAVGFPERQAERADADYQREFMEKYHPAPFPSVQEMLFRLHEAGLILGLVTSNVRANIEKSMGETWKLFDPKLCFTFDHPNHVTKAAALGAGLRQLGLLPYQVLFVGDQISDIQAAREAGVPFLGVTFGWGISADDMELSLVNSPAQIQEYVLRKETEVDEHLRVGLEHGRAMFVYHAGQRHGSLNFYFAVLAAFVAAFAALFTSDQLWKVPGNMAPTIATALACAAIALTGFFLLLDFRNRALVKCDEKLIKAVERTLADRYSVEDFKIIECSDAKEKANPLISYKWIVPLILAVFVSIWVGGAIGSYYYYDQVQSRQQKASAGKQVPPRTGQEKAVGAEPGKGK